MRSLRKGQRQALLINIVLFLIIITKTKEDITFILALPLPTTLFKLLAVRSISAGCGSSVLLLCTSVERAREWNNRQECLELMQTLDHRVRVATRSMVTEMHMLRRVAMRDEKRKQARAIWWVAEATVHGESTHNAFHSGEEQAATFITLF